MQIKVYAEHGQFGRGCNVVIASTQPNGEVRIAKPLEMVDVHPQSLWPETMTGDFGEQFLRAALNAAWGLGMRPDGFNDTTEQVKAIKEHLADMRRLVFDEPKAEKIFSEPMGRLD